MKRKVCLSCGVEIPHRGYCESCQKQRRTPPPPLQEPISDTSLARLPAKYWPYMITGMAAAYGMAERTEMEEGTRKWPYERRKRYNERK